MRAMVIEVTNFIDRTRRRVDAENGFGLFPPMAFKGFRPRSEGGPPWRHPNPDRFRER
jgi:hypothetical protein